MSGIQRNRGCHIRNLPSGGQIAMYVDDPGVYYDARGVIASDALAREAGFPVDEDQKARAVVLKRREFERKLAAAADESDDALSSSMASALAGPNLRGLTVQKSATDKSKFDVVDVDGKVVNRKPLTKGAAQSLIDTIGEPADEEEGDDDQEDDLV